MTISFVTCNNQDIWQKKVAKFEAYSFMQGKDFWEYATLRGYQTQAIILQENGKTRSLCLAYIVRAKRGTYLAISHGPLFQKNQFDARLFEAWNGYWTTFARKNGCHFIRISPPWDKLILSKITGFIPSPIHLHAEQTSIINLTKSDQELLANMRKNTRNSIRKSLNLEKEGVFTVALAYNLTEEMYKIYQSTTSRGKFTGVNKKTIENEIQAFGRDDLVRIITVSTQGVMISWGMFIVSGNRAYYRHGANRLSSEYRNLPSPYLVYWKAFQEARKMGAVSYDLWGVSPKSAINHPWKNISLYKSGFEGEYRELAHAIDKPLSVLYWATRFYDGYQARSRGFHY